MDKVKNRYLFVSIKAAVLLQASVVDHDHSVGNAVYIFHMASKTIGAPLRTGWVLPSFSYKDRLYKNRFLFLTNVMVG